MADIKKIFGAVAPFLSVAASLIPGGGPVVNIAAQVLSKITGKEVKPDSIVDTMTSLSTTEAGRLQLQESEQEFQKAMSQMKFDTIDKMLALDNDDRASARGREIAVKDHTPAVLAVAITLGFFGMLALVALHGVKPESKDLCNVMLGSLGAAWLAVVTYYFGSSAGSQAKTDLLAKAQPIVQ